MNEKEAKEKILSLTKTLQEHNYKYYVLDCPTLSDFDFDIQLKQLQKLEEQFPQFASSSSPTIRVGGKVTKNFETHTHEHRMYSLDNVYSLEELDSWKRRIEKTIEDEEIEYVCELKYDGLSISLTYEEGQLVKAVTRGDGLRGDTVTENIKTIKNVPLKLRFQNAPSVFHIRGEVILTKDGFLNMNKERLENGLEPYANPRNTASGSLKLQDSAEVARRPLSCFLYSIVVDQPFFDTQEEILEFATKAGFKVPKTYKKCKNLEEVKEYINEWENKRNDLPYETDGVVVKVNRVSLQNVLGHTAKSPRWSVAYKFQGESVQTILQSVSYQVGRTGAITPVANLSPVLLGGTTVKRASLHNESVIEKLDLYFGDTVFIEKGGEIIPKVTAVNFALRKAGQKKVLFISECPECNTKLEKNEGEAQHFCPNFYGCTPQISGRIAHFVSRKAMNIDSIGGETITMLYKANLVNNVADLYDLNIADLLPLERVAQKSAENIIDGIQQSKVNPFHKVLYGLGIRHVGETVAKKLAKHFKSIQAISIASKEELESVDDIGEKIAISIIAFFADEENKTVVRRLEEKNIQLEVSLDERINNKLDNKSFLFTGKLSLFTRAEASEMVEQNGGVNLSAINSKLNYLIVGENAGSKLKKAEQLGTVIILNEEEFLALVGNEK